MGYAFRSGESTVSHHLLPPQICIMTQYGHIVVYEMFHFPHQTVMSIIGLPADPKTAVLVPYLALLLLVVMQRLCYERVTDSRAKHSRTQQLNFVLIRIACYLCFAGMALYQKVCHRPFPPLRLLRFGKGCDACRRWYQQHRHVLPPKRKTTNPEARSVQCCITRIRWGRLLPWERMREGSCAFGGCHKVVTSLPAPPPFRRISQPKARPSVGPGSSPVKWGLLCLRSSSAP